MKNYKYVNYANMKQTERTGERAAKQYGLNWVLPFGKSETNEEREKRIKKK